MENSLNLKKIKRRALLREQLPSYIMLAPFFIFFIVFLVLPILSSIVLSFTNFDMINTPSFAGLGNYMRMFLEDDVFASQKMITSTADDKLKESFNNFMVRYTKGLKVERAAVEL